MTERALTAREETLLQLVAEGAGTWSTKTIDIIMSARYGRGFAGPVMHELRGLERKGLLTFDPTGGGFGRWSLAAEARRHREGDGQS